MLKGYLSIEWIYLLIIGLLGLADNEEAHKDLLRYAKKLVYIEDIHPINMIVTIEGIEQTKCWTKQGSGEEIRQEELAETQDMSWNPKMVPSADRHWCCDKLLEEILKCTPSLLRLFLRFFNSMAGMGTAH